MKPRTRQITPTPETLDLGERIKQLRSYLGLKQADLAKVFGVSRPTIATYEAGKATVSLGHALHLCEVFLINPKWLLTGDGVWWERCEDDLTFSFPFLGRSALEFAEEIQSQSTRPPQFPAQLIEILRHSVDDDQFETEEYQIAARKILFILNSLL